MTLNPHPHPNKFTKHSEAGLTIIELLIVLVILSLIATVTTVQIMNQFQRAQSDIVGIQIQKLKYAIELYQIDVGAYPNSEQGLNSLFENPQDVAGWRGPYITNRDELLDPWKTQLRIEMSGENKGYSIISAGPDRTFDNESDNITVEVKN